MLPQAAIAHAQFETIHPCTDGNGRAGRALLHSMLRSKALTRSVTVPRVGRSARGHRGLLRGADGLPRR
ncbi:MAG: Fic family protein [Actinomycetota bacterium]|nr:Fic family protein [Actinomycetota bacterium]